MDSTFVVWVIVVICVIGAIVTRVAKWLEEDELKKANPEAWVRLKEIENDKLRRKHENRTMGMKMGWSIASWFFKNYWQ